MVQGTATATARRHIIRRPRLTQLLDTSDARTILVVAPAGYGKTTLLREWVSLGHGGVAWYQPTAEAHDLASVALGLLRELAPAVDLARSSVLQRLRQASDPMRDIASVVEAFLSDLSAANSADRMVVDDYHLLMSESPIDDFVGAVVENAPIKAVIASRVRPSWVTARKVLYGEVYEIGRAVLAMTGDEAAEVLATQPGSQGLPGLVALADGWPAVIGLAALAQASEEIPEADVPEALHAFFADELFQSAPETVREALVRMSFVPVISKALVNALFGAAAEQVAVEAVRLGFLTPLGERYELHPLLRSFLRAKAPAPPSPALHAFAEGIARFYLDNGLWSEAFAVVKEWKLENLVETLTERALDDFLAEGRMSDARSLIALCRAASPDAPVVALGDAELAFREGRTTASEPIALEAARRLPPNHHLTSRLFHRAGQSAHLSNNALEALAAFERAEATATSTPDRGRALWGRFVTAMELERFDEAREALAVFQALPLTGPEDLLRRAQARLTIAVRVGEGVDQAVARTTDSFGVVDGATDPVAITGFLSLYANSCCLTANYDRGLEAAERLFAISQRANLDVVLPHALNMKAAGRLGLRQFAQAARDLRGAAREASALRDAYSEANTAALTGRLEVMTGRPHSAISVLDPYDHHALPARGLQSEVLASLALALACVGESSRAIETANRSHEISRGADSRALQSFAIVIALDQESSSATSVAEQLETAMREMRTSGSVDSLVCAYRGYPRLLRLLETEHHGDAIRVVVKNDPSLAAKARLSKPLQATSDLSTLTPREKEVLGLVKRGLSNRAIAQALWISESTAKVHVRRVLRKLGAKNRAEAAALTDDSTK